MQTLTTLFNIEGLHFLLRWLHTFAGIVWIGHLYYLNFVQGAFMNEVDAPIKSAAQRKLFPRAFWWFRYGALWTFVFGLVLLMIRSHQQGGMPANSYWVNILTGAAMATVMAANVWFVIWPAQKRVIASAEAVAAGGTADPLAAPGAARAAVASRTNVLLSVPMLFFMNAAMHWSYGVAEGGATVYWIVSLLVLAAIEGNALKGKTGPMTTIKGVICCAFALWLLYVLMISFLIQAPAA